MISGRLVESDIIFYDKFIFYLSHFYVTLRNMELERLDVCSYLPHWSTTQITLFSALYIHDTQTHVHS